VKFAAELFARELRPGVDKKKPDYALSEAYPAPLAKAKGHYRYQLILRATTTRLMTQPLRELLQRRCVPTDVTVTVDVDAMDLM